MAKIRDMIPAFELLQPETVEDAMELVSSGTPIPGHEVRIVDGAGRELAERQLVDA